MRKQENKFWISPQRHREHGEEKNNELVIYIKRNENNIITRGNLFKKMGGFRYLKIYFCVPLN